MNFTSGTLFYSTLYFTQVIITGREVSVQDFILWQKGKYNFPLRSHEAACRQGLLEGYKVHVTKKVKPEPSQMKGKKLNKWLCVSYPDNKKAGCITMLSGILGRCLNLFKIGWFKYTCITCGMEVALNFSMYFVCKKVLTLSKYFWNLRMNDQWLSW